MGRRKDAIWNHAWEVPNGFICKYCNSQFSSGASRIKQHLLGGSTNITKCTRVPLYVQEKLSRKYKGHDQWP